MSMILNSSMLSLLKNFIFIHKDKEDEFDIVMLNTSSVRENANNKIYNRVHEIKRAAKGRNILKEKT